MWFDSHCHLYEAGDANGVSGVIDRARAASVTAMCVLGTDAATSARAADLTVHEGIYAGAAFHPTETKGWNGGRLEHLAPLFERPAVVAVGESGLDRHWDDSYLEDQIAAFRAHIALAKERELALVIHTRASMDDALWVLRDEGPPPRFVFHCWSGDEVQLERALEIGAFVSFAGNVTFKSADALRNAARRVPRDRLLVETDSPYLAPVPHRGRPNEPAYLPLVGAAVAAARGEEVGDVELATTANAHRLFAL